MCDTEFMKIIASILTTALAGIIGYLSARRISNFNTIRTAEANLRAAFAPSLAVIYMSRKHSHLHADEVPHFDVDKFLKDTLLTQASAIEVFRPHISKSKRTAYQEAWEKYRYEVWDYGFGPTEFRTDIDDPGKVFEDLIHNILRFAELK